MKLTIKFYEQNSNYRRFAKYLIDLIFLTFTIANHEYYIHHSLHNNNLYQCLS